MAVKFDAIQFSVNNILEDPECIITATPDSATPLESLRNDLPARQARFPDLSGDIVIEVECPTPQVATYFAIPGSNIPSNANITVELFETLTSSTDLLGLGTLNVGDLIPLGVWQAGIDPYAGGNPVNDGRRVFALWFDGPIQFQRLKLTIDHQLTFVAPTDPPPIITPNGIFRQSHSTGVVSIDAESAEAFAVGNDAWIIQSDPGATGTQRYKSGPEFYEAGSPFAGPHIDFNFTATSTGLHDVWARLHSDDGNSLYAVADGNVQTRIFHGNELVGQGHVWLFLRTMALTNESLHQFSIYARDHFMSVDKLLIYPAGSPAPAGNGQVESQQGETTTFASGVVLDESSSINIRHLMLGRHETIQNNFSYGGTTQQIDDPELFETESGFYVAGRTQRPVRRLQLPFEGLNDRDRLILSSMEAERAGRSFLINPYPIKGRQQWFTDQHIMLAKFSEALVFRHRFEDIHSTTLNLIEV